MEKKKTRTLNNYWKIDGITSPTKEEDIMKKPQTQENEKHL